MKWVTLGHDRTGLNLRTDGLKADFPVAGIYLGIGKRNELCFARHRREFPGLPIFFGLLDPFPARGHEIPPDVARALQCGAAEKHHSRRVRCPDRDAVARSHLASRALLNGDFRPRGIFRAPAL